MTGDEIDAAIAALIPDGTIIRRLDAGRLIYRAGMRRAAKIARRVAGECFAVSNVERSVGADIAAAAIEREAAE